MAKILVADDNSNVQKTVALALTELGVEVVAVNNGDAAVRKLADISPDLVLADIFMPVRNGYEVCEYVKKNSRFAGVPVVLLVGAFDPLDEREAQRVGADGILKKPFVPPDPLITMVKTLLDRTLGDRLVAAAVSKTSTSMQGHARGVATTEEHSPAPVDSKEMSENEFPPPVDRLTFGEDERPMAFGQLLDTPVSEASATSPEMLEPVDDEQVLTSSRDASLGDPIFWKTEEPQPETDEENSEAKEEEASSSLSMLGWKPGEESLPRGVEPDVSQPVEPFELVRDEKDEEAEPISAIVESSPLIAQDPASQAALTVEAARPEDLAANPIEWMASVAPPMEEEPEVAPDWSAAVIESHDDIAVNEAEDLISALEPVAPESTPAVPAPVLDSTPATRPVLPLAATPAKPVEVTESPVDDPQKTRPSFNPFSQSAEDTARSIPKQDWADLAASLQAKPLEPFAEKPKPTQVSVAETPAMPPAVSQTLATREVQASGMPSAILQTLVPPEAKAPDMPPANSQPAPDPTGLIPASLGADNLPAFGNIAPNGSPDPALVEAVVQRILDKMRPQVMDLITKEFLRPIVQALVHREIEKH